MRDAPVEKRKDGEPLLINRKFSSGGTVSNAEFRDLVENRIDRSVDVIRFDHAPRARFLDDVEFRLGTDSGFHVIPPSELRSSASQLNEEEGRADAGPKRDERLPVVRG